MFWIVTHISLWIFDRKLIENDKMHWIHFTVYWQLSSANALNRFPTFLLLHQSYWCSYIGMHRVSNGLSPHLKGFAGHCWWKEWTTVCNCCHLMAACCIVQNNCLPGSMHFSVFWPNMNLYYLTCFFLSAPGASLCPACPVLLKYNKLINLAVLYVNIPSILELGQWFPKLNLICYSTLMSSSLHCSCWSLLLKAGSYFFVVLTERNKYILSEGEECVLKS